MRKNLLKLLAICAISVLAGCGDSGGGDSSGGGREPSGDPATRSGTECGLVANGGFENSPVYSDGDVVTSIQILDSNLARITSRATSRLVKFHALGGTTSFNNTAAVKKLTALANSDTVYFFKAGNCSAETAAGTAEIGNLVTAGGISFSETVLQDYVGGVVETSGSCKEGEISSCYQALYEPETADNNSDQDDSSQDSSTKIQVSDFLWKPDSESGYNPGGVSILLNPCDVDVYVNGTEIRQYPSGNGRCVTVRSGSPGCDFGSDVQITLKKGGETVYFGENPSLTIPNGCERFEFEGDDSGNGADGGASGGDSGDVAHECDTAPATVRYDPAHEPCGGNAAVILSGQFQDAFSVQLRLPDGGDRLDEECADANCSPYKVQKYINSDVKTACFGAPGAANLMANVHHTSIKMAGDDSDPDRFCIPDPTEGVN